MIRTIRSLIFYCLFGMMLLFSGSAFSQCETWIKSSEIENLENAYALYKSFMMSGDFENAYLQWEILYKSAPALDGRRSTAFSDGRILLEKKFNIEKEVEKKYEIRDFILRLIEEQKQCFPESKIVYPSKQILEFR